MVFFILKDEAFLSGGEGKETFNLKSIYLCAEGAKSSLNKLSGLCK